MLRMSRDQLNFGIAGQWNFFVAAVPGLNGFGQRGEQNLLVAGAYLAGGCREGGFGGVDRRRRYPLRRVGATRPLPEDTATCWCTQYMATRMAIFGSRNRFESMP
jgi:hypothetical protein